MYAVGAGARTSLARLFLLAPFLSLSRTLSHHPSQFRLVLNYIPLYTMSLSLLTSPQSSPANPSLVAVCRTSFSQLSTSPSASVSQPIQSPQQQPQHPGHSLAQSPSHSHTLSQSHSRTPSYSSGPPPLPSASPATANQTKILLLANFSPELKTRDIQLLFGEWEDDRGGLKVKWIDDSSCWIVFNDASVGESCVCFLRCRVGMRSIA